MRTRRSLSTVILIIVEYDGGGDYDGSGDSGDCGDHGDIQLGALLPDGR